MRKYILLILIAIPFTFWNCADNSDDPVEPPKPPVTAETTIGNMIGEWEVYYVSKKVRLNKDQNPIELRDIGGEGYRVIISNPSPYTYLGANGKSVETTEAEYAEYNANSDKTRWGKIVVVTEKKDSIRFRGSMIVGDDLHLVEDTTVYFKPTITEANKFLGFTEKYYRYTTEQYFEITDTRRFRNALTVPGQHPDVPKEVVTKDFLTQGTGSWIIAGYKYYIGEGDKWIEQSPSGGSPVGSTFTFRADGTYTSTNPTKSNQSKPGWYVIFDDVIHMFYEEAELDASGKPVVGSASLNVSLFTSLGFVDVSYSYSVFSGFLKTEKRETTFRRN